MTTDTPTQLPTIDPALLMDVVRQDQRSPNFEITSWTAGKLSDKGVLGEDALILFKGEGRDARGSRRWSVVLKMFKVNSNPEIAIDSFWYWGRELAVGRSDLLERLPEQVRATRFYGSTEWDGKVGLWMEHIVGDAPDIWGLDEYAFAARRLGQFNAACLNVQLPAYPWFVRDTISDWHSAWNPDAGWDDPFVQRHLSARTGERIMKLWSERHAFRTVLDAMPQIFSHGDAQRRNLIPSKYGVGERELVAVDWALCHIGPLGADSAKLVGTAGMFFDWPPAALKELDECVFAAYVAGLSDAGWQGDPRQIRLGSAAWLAMRYGIFAPRAIATFTKDTMDAMSLRLCGCKGDALAAGLVALNEFALDRADEARELIRQLNFS